MFCCCAEQSDLGPDSACAAEAQAIPMHDGCIVGPVAMKVARPSGHKKLSIAYTVELKMDEERTPLGIELVWPDLTVGSVTHGLAATYNAKVGNAHQIMGGDRLVSFNGVVGGSQILAAMQNVYHTPAYGQSMLFKFIRE
eukprot:TRINITY_DN48390_c0_g1_i1.p1 TRINITY_DN48390_c0_g1~~TRINITY_DN48390_c0_g1_i1.p1  ORF type:complete len:140 (-),score=16.19 TRINITY_DN48390_c0_g1_i1:232-651(-)